MFVALTVCLLAILVGAVIGGTAHRGHLGLVALRTFATGAVLSVVVLQILPEAVHEAGAGAFVLFAAVLVLPTAIGHMLRWVRRGVPVETLGADLSYVGFLGHQAGEGLVLATLVSAHGELVIAVAAHTVPLTAVLVRAWARARGQRAAMRRVLGIAVATAIGFALAGPLATATIDRAEPWLAAAVAGLLCHVLLHEDAPAAQRRTIDRAVEMLALAVGLALPWMFAEHEGPLRPEFVGAFADLAATVALPLLIALALGATLEPWLARAAAHGRWRVLAAAVAPLSGMGVLPAAASLRAAGLGPAAVVAFLVAAPQLGLELFALTWHMLGAPFAVARLAIALGLVAVVALCFMGARPSVDAHAHHHPPHRDSRFSVFDELLLHHAPWMLVGLCAAALLRVGLPADALVEFSAHGWHLLVVAAIVLPVYIAPAGVVPVAAVLLEKGLSPGAVLVGLCLGPALSLAGIEALRRAYGRARVSIGVATGVAFVALAGMFTEVVPVSTARATPTVAPSIAWMQGFALAALATGCAAQLWRWGIGAWFRILDLAGHAHGDGDDHLHREGSHAHGHLEHHDH